MHLTVPAYKIMLKKEKVQEYQVKVWSEDAFVALQAALTVRIGQCLLSHLTTLVN